MTQIVRCKIENILGIKDAEFAPNGESVTIGGANGQGKSSAIWAIVMALGGKKFVPSVPVHAGAARGGVIVELDRFTVTMELTADGGHRLKVEAKDGAKYATPQTLLNDLFGGLTFDPGQFMAMDSAKRLRTLQELVGINLLPFDVEEKELTEARRDIGRRVRELEGKTAGRMLIEDLPGEEESADEIFRELEKAQEHNRRIEGLRLTLRSIDGNIGACARRHTDLSNEVERKKREIQELEAIIAENEADRNLQETNRGTVEQQISELEAIECGPIHQRLKDLDETNRLIRENAEILSLQRELADAKAEYSAYTDKLTTLDLKRIAILEAAKFPLDGLSFTKEGVTFNGIPFEQISESQQWEVSTAIGFALNQKGILFMRNSGGLDRRSRDRIRARAAACGVQLFLEVVDDAEDVQILIEEGGIKEDRLRSLNSEETNDNGSREATHAGS